MSNLLNSFTNYLPFAGRDRSRSYAPSPVWRNSTTAEIKFSPMPKKQAVKLWHEARHFERSTRLPGKQDGALGRNGLAVLHAFLFDFLNYAGGRLDPAIKTIANAANISPRSAARGLAKLKAWRVVNWVRRCVVEAGEAGGVVFKQISSAYAVLPVSQWLGYRPRPVAPPPERDTWGAAPRIPGAFDEAVMAGTSAEKIKALELEPDNEVAAAMAALGRRIAAVEEKARQTGRFTELPV